MSETLVYAPPSSRLPAASRSRSWLTWLAALVVLALTGCQSPVDKANAYEQLYDQMIPNKAYPAARQAILVATRLDENEPRRWIKLGDVEMALNRQGPAYLAYQHAFDLAPDSIDALQNLAILAVRARDFSNAKRYTETLILLAPNNMAGRLATGAIAVNDRKFDQADTIAKQMMVDAPDLADGYALQIMNLRAQKRTAEAAAILEKRWIANPADSGQLVQLLEIYRSRGDVAGVRKTAQRLAPLFPDDPRYAMEAARAIYAEGRHDEAQGKVAALARKYRYNPGMALAISQFWRQTLPPQAALERMMQLADQGSIASKAALGNVMLDLGATPQTLTLLAPIARDKVAAGNVEPQVTFARALFIAGRTDDASARVAEILKFDETNVPALLLRARLNFARRDYEAALNDAQLASAGDQGNEEAALLVGRIYATMGNKALALRAFGKARRNFPDSMTVIKAWTDTALADRDPTQALSVAADFARRHPRSKEAWTLYGKLCAPPADLLCAIEVRDHR